MENSVFNELYQVEVNEHTEQKNGLTYLSWAWAWKEVKERYPDANYTIYERESEYGAINYFTDGRTCWVKTGVTINGLEHIEYLPVMDFRNKSIPLDQVTSFDVNKAIQRSLTKAVARHGLGLYIYAGEDLPEGAMPKHWDVDIVDKAEKLGIDFNKLATHLNKTKYQLTNADFEYAIKQKERMNKNLDKGDIEV